MNNNPLFNRRWPKSYLVQDIDQMDALAYAQAYRDLKEQAPKRAYDRPYLNPRDRDGYPSTTGKTNRREEHFAIALWDAQPVWAMPDGTKFKLLDYQVPLKARRADTGIGKIDIFGLTEHGRAVVVELKSVGHSGGPGDPPPVALLEGLAYAAIVEANLERIAKEVRRTYDREMVPEKPVIVVLGEAGWWSGWRQVKTALEAKTGEISKAIGIHIVFASLPNTQVDYGDRTKKPRLSQVPELGYPQHLIPKSAIAPKRS